MACSLAFKSLKNEEEVPTPKQPDLQLRWVPQLYTAVVFLPTDSNNTAFNLQSIPPAWQQSCYGRIVKTSVELYSRCSSVKCGRVSTTTCTEIKPKISHSLVPSQRNMCDEVNPEHQPSNRYSCFLLPLRKFPSIPIPLLLLIIMLPVPSITSKLYNRDISHNISHNISQILRSSERHLSLMCCLSPSHNIELCLILHRLRPTLRLNARF